MIVVVYLRLPEIKDPNGPAADAAIEHIELEMKALCEHFNTSSFHIDDAYMGKSEGVPRRHRARL